MLHEFFQLERPIVALDVETHDKAEPEQLHICEIGFIMFYPDGREPKRWETFVKPPVPITEGATGVHNITNAMVENAPRWRDIGPSLAKGFVNCDFWGYNVRFDIRCIAVEMQRISLGWSYEGARLFDPYKIWNLASPRTLTGAVEEFCGRKTTDAHRALGDTQDAIDVGVAMLRRFKDRLPMNLQQLHDLCFDGVDPDRKFVWDDNGEAVFKFGKYIDKSLKWVVGRDPQYLSKFMLGGSFSPEVKRIVIEALAGRFPERKKSNA